MLIPQNGSKEGRHIKILVNVSLVDPLVRGTTILLNGNKRLVEFIDVLIFVILWAYWSF